MDYLSLQDFSYDDSSLSDEDSLDREELEVALYSQIHFETNQDYDDQDFVDPDHTEYVIKVDGNTKTGFFTNKTTPDIILNNELGEKYNDNVCDNSMVLVSSPNKSVLDNSVICLDDSIDLAKGKDKQISNDIHSHDTGIHKSQKNDNVKSKMDKQKENRKHEKKSNLAEELILGTNDSDDDVEIISDPDESENVVEIIIGDESDNQTSKASKNSASLKSNREQLDIGDKDDQMKSSRDHFVEALTDDSDGSDLDDLYIGTTSNSKKQSVSDIQFNIDGGVLPSEDSDQESINEADWKISFADTKTKMQNRYFKPVICFNCKEKGHTSKTCQKPKKEKVCVLCAEEGHIARQCPESFCYNCFEIGHTGKDCRTRNQRYKVCHRCYMEGHEAQRCPDEWRQYHLTIKPGKLVRGKARTDAPVSCYNCGDDDHFGHECEMEGANKFVRFTTPYICTYRQHRLYKDTELTSDIHEREPFERYEPSPKRKKTNHRDDRSNRHSYRNNDDDDYDVYNIRDKRKKKDHRDNRSNRHSYRKNDYINNNNNNTRDDHDHDDIGDASIIEDYFVKPTANKSRAIPNKKREKEVSWFVPFGKDSSKSIGSERSNPEHFNKSRSKEQEGVADFFPKPRNCSLIQAADTRFLKKSEDKQDDSLIMDEGGLCINVEIGDKSPHKRNKKDKKMKNKQDRNYKKKNLSVNCGESFKTIGNKVHERNVKDHERMNKNFGNKTEYGVPKQDYYKTMGNKKNFHDVLSKSGKFKHKSNKGKWRNKNDEHVNNFNGSFGTRLRDVENNVIPSNSRGFKTHLSFGMLSQNNEQFKNLRVTFGDKKGRSAELDNFNGSVINFRNNSRKGKRKR